MSAYCSLCRRSFKEQEDLNRHVQSSSVHKRPFQPPSQGQNLLQVKPPCIKPSRQEQPGSSHFKLAEPPQNPQSSRHTHTTAEHRPGAPQNAATSSRYPLHTISPTAKNVPQDVKPRWSVVSESEYTAVLNALSANCHSLGELEQNRYLVHPYDPADYINSRKCKRCHSKVLVLIIDLR